MHTAVDRTFRGTKALTPVCALPQFKSFLVEQATRGAGSALYELLGMAELMRVAYEKGELESLQERLSELICDASSLSATLSNILQLSRLEADAAQPALRQFDVAAMLHDVAQTARVRLGNKPVTVMDPSAPGPLVVYSDPGKVRQIMTEIANNAAAFTDRGRIALIICRDKERLRLVVTDTGRGMTAEEIHLFFHADEHAFSGEGSTAPGLGLTIVKRLVRSLGGTLTASSKHGEGTIVEVGLPLACDQPHVADDRGRRLVRV